MLADRRDAVNFGQHRITEAAAAHNKVEAGQNGGATILTFGLAAVAYLLRLVYLLSGYMLHSFKARKVSHQVLRQTVCIENWNPALVWLVVRLPANLATAAECCRRMWSWR